MSRTGKREGKVHRKRLKQRMRAEGQAKDDNAEPTNARFSVSGQRMSGSEVILLKATVLRSPSMYASDYTMSGLIYFLLHAL